MDRLEWGYCHGDFHGGNARVAAGTLRVFDFDSGSPGWRAYDLAVARLYFAEESSWQAFRRGYEEVRPLPDADAIPWFLPTRQLWRMALFAAHWPLFTGGKDVDDGFLDQHLGILRERIEKYLPKVTVHGS